MLTATHDWVRLFEGETAGDLMRALPDILQARRWFGGKARRIEKVRHPRFHCHPIRFDVDTPVDSGGVRAGWD